MKIRMLSVFALCVSGSLMLAGCGGGGNQQSSGSDQSAEESKESKESMEKADEDMEKEEEKASAKEDEEKIVDKTGMDGPVEITVKTPGTTMQNMRYDVDEIHLNKGQKVKLTLKNVAPEDAAAMKHNFVVVKKADAKEVATKGMKAGSEKGYLPENKEKIKAHTEVLEQGEETTITFTIDEAGTYEYVCTYPGHYPTMKGTIMVKEAM